MEQIQHDPFKDPFGGSISGRVYTKIAKTAAADFDYSVTQTKTENNFWKKVSDWAYGKNKDKEATNVDSFEKQHSSDATFEDDIANDQPKDVQQTTWQKAKTAISNWWNNNKTSDANSPDSPDYVPVSSMPSERQTDVGQ